MSRNLTKIFEQLNYHEPCFTHPCIYCVLQGGARGDIDDALVGLVTCIHQITLDFSFSTPLQYCNIHYDFHELPATATAPWLTSHAPMAGIYTATGWCTLSNPSYLDVVARQITAASHHFRRIHCRFELIASWCNRSPK